MGPHQRVASGRCYICRRAAAGRRRTGRNRLGESWPKGGWRRAQALARRPARRPPQARSMVGPGRTPPCYRARPTATCACGAHPTARPTAHALQRTVKSKSAANHHHGVRFNAVCNQAGCSHSAVWRLITLSWYRRPAPRFLAPLKFSACQTQRPALRWQPEAGRR